MNIPEYDHPNNRLEQDIHKVEKLGKWGLQAKNEGQQQLRPMNSQTKRRLKYGLEPTTTSARQMRKCSEITLISNVG